MKCQTVEKRLSDYLDGSLSPKQSAGIESHLMECLSCSQALDAFRLLTQDAKNLEKRQAPTDLWQQIEAELDAEPASGWRRLRERLKDTLRLADINLQAPAFKLSGALALIALGILIGRNFTPTRPDLQPAKVMSYSPVQLASRTDNYIEKSKVLFLGMINESRADARYADFTLERKIADGLVSEAAFLKENLDPMAQSRLKALVEELEVILLEIANLEDKHDFENIELIQSGIEREGVLLKINLHDLSGEEQRTSPSL